MEGLAPTASQIADRRARSARIDRVRWATSACFESHGVRLGVRCNVHSLADRLPALLPPGSREVEGPAADARFSLWLPDARSRRPARVYTAGERRACTRDLELALAALESELRHAVATHAPDHTFVHAGVVGFRDRAILLPGRSRSGKTTLVAELVRAGALYLSDEYAVLDARGRVHPFPKKLSFRGPGGCDRHARQAAVEEIGGRAARGPLPVGLVAVTEYQPGASWNPLPLSPGQALLELLAHTVPARLRPAAALEALGTALSGAALLKGFRGEAADTASRLLQCERSAAGAAEGAFA